MITINIRQEDMKRALAIYTHLRNIYSTIISSDGNIIRPIDMDQGKLLLASNSLRCLLFETHPTQPMLIKFTNDYSINFKIHYFETNINLFFFSYFVPDKIHISDLLVEAMFAKERQDDFPFNIEKEIFMVFLNHSAMTSLLKRYDLWVPNIDEDKNSQQNVFLFSNPGQIIKITRRQSSLEEWTKSRIGYLKTISIPRRRIVTYVANELGGVHYDSRNGQPSTEDGQLIRRLMTIFDWEYQSIMHSGFTIVALTCLELFSVPEVYLLMNELEKMLTQRQKRLLTNTQ